MALLGAWTQRCWGYTRGPQDGLIEITDGAFLDSSPAWSPDSQTIYFDRTPIGDFDPGIWKIGFDPGG